jgi:hypothetical protein
MANSTLPSKKFLSTGLLPDYLAREVASELVIFLLQRLD